MDILGGAAAAVLRPPGAMEAVPEYRGKVFLTERRTSGCNGLPRQRQLDALNGKRHTAKPDACCVEERVRHRGCDGHRRRLSTAPQRFFGPLDQNHLDRRHFGEAQDGIARPIDARHARLVELHLLVERTAQALDDAAFNLVPQRIGDSRPDRSRGRRRRADVDAIDARILDRTSDRDESWRQRPFRVAAKRVLKVSCKDSDGRGR